MLWLALFLFVVLLVFVLSCVGHKEDSDDSPFVRLAGAIAFTAVVPYVLFLLILEIPLRIVFPRAMLDRLFFGETEVGFTFTKSSDKTETDKE